jgi:hypothetical protein
MKSDSMKDKKKLVDFVVDALIILGLTSLVVMGWYFLEMLMLGDINPNSVDSIIALILIISLYANLEHWIKKY